MATDGAPIFTDEFRFIGGDRCPLGFPAQSDSDSLRRDAEARRRSLFVVCSLLLVVRSHQSPAATANKQQTTNNAQQTTHKKTTINNQSSPRLCVSAVKRETCPFFLPILFGAAARSDIVHCRCFPPRAQGGRWARLEFNLISPPAGTTWGTPCHAKTLTQLVSPRRRQSLDRPALAMSPKRWSGGCC